MEAEYNDIQQWRYKDIVHVFGGDKVGAKTYQIKSREEADKLFNDTEFAAAKHLQVSEVSPFMVAWY